MKLNESLTCIKFICLSYMLTRLILITFLLDISLKSESIFHDCS